MVAADLCILESGTLDASIAAVATLRPHCGSASLTTPVTRTQPRPLLLVVDDEQPVLRVVERLAAKVGFDVVTCGSGSEAMRALLRKPADLAMLDLRMPDVNGLDLLRQIRSTVPSCEFILMPAHAAVDSAVEAIKRGAREYLTKPFDFDRLREVLVEIREELERRAQVVELESQVARQLEFCGMMGRSPVMQELFSLIQRLAPHAKVVLISGETGTGKELAAPNRDVGAEVAAGRFRDDLFYRLNVVDVTLPPLRDRREDIPYLTAAFMRDCAGRMRKPLNGLTHAAERLLLNARWDGNVRELKNVIERACMLVEGTTVSERELAGVFGPDLPATPARGRSAEPAGRATEGAAPLDEIEREHILEVLRQVKGNRMKAAKVLGISRRALYRRLERHQLGGEAPRPSSVRKSS